MALSAQTLQADLDALERAINTGATRVEYQDRKVSYRSLAEMQAAARRLRIQLGQAAPGPRRSIVQTRNNLEGGQG